MRARGCVLWCVCIAALAHSTAVHTPTQINGYDCRPLLLFTPAKPASLLARAHPAQAPWSELESASCEATSEQPCTLAGRGATAARSPLKCMLILAGLHPLTASSAALPWLAPPPIDCTRPQVTPQVTQDLLWLRAFAGTSPHLGCHWERMPWLLVSIPRLSLMVQGYAQLLAPARRTHLAWGASVVMRWAAARLPGIGAVSWGPLGLQSRSTHSCPASASCKHALTFQGAMSQFQFSQPHVHHWNLQLECSPYAAMMPGSCDYVDFDCKLDCNPRTLKEGYTF